MAKTLWSGRGKLSNKGLARQVQCLAVLSAYSTLEVVATSICDGACTREVPQLKHSRYWY